MIIESPCDDVELVPVPLHDYVLHGAEGRGSRPAIIEGPTGRVLTYGELASSVRKAAAGLAARGVAQGDVLALCSPNSPGIRRRLLWRPRRRGARHHRQPAGASG
jgi:acyl-CoA synthetase (AMP-forming)/AMP-acid ligase II